MSRRRHANAGRPSGFPIAQSEGFKYSQNLKWMLQVFHLLVGKSWLGRIRPGQEFHGRCRSSASARYPGESWNWSQRLQDKKENKMPSSESDTLTLASPATTQSEIYLSKLAELPRRERIPKILSISPTPEDHEVLRCILNGVCQIGDASTCREA